MRLKLLIGLVIVCAARRAEAERSIVVEVTFAAPFDAAELTTAMRVRLAPEGPPVRVRVTLTPTGVQVEAPGGKRDLALTGLDHTDAARLVALAANDLLLDDLALAPAPPRTASPLGISILGGRPLEMCERLGSVDDRQTASLDLGVPPS